MYKILIHIDTQSGDKWFYYQENGKDYVTNSLQEIKDTVLTLIDVYGEDYIKIVKQMSGQDMNNADEYLYNSTDSYEDLDNRPFINGVEIVGQLSLEDLGIQPAGDYLDQTDLEEIENKINSIDVSAYATNERVDQVEDKIDNIDLNGFYTKEETDAKDNERLRGYFWDYKGNCITIGSSLERISQSRYGTTFQELSALWDQIAVGGMHPIEVKDKNNYRAWLMPNGTAGGSTYIIYKYRGQVILNTPSSAADASLYRSYYLEFRVNRDDNKLWEADFLCKEGYEQPSMARVENYVQEQMVNLSDNYVQKDEVLLTDGTTVYTPTEDYNPATKKYVDDAVTNIDIPEDKPIYTISISNAHLLDNPSGITTLNEETIAELDVIVKDAAKKGYAFLMIYTYYKNQNHQMLFSSGEGDDLLDKPAYINIYGETVRGRYTTSGQLHRKYSCQLRINMTWDNDVPTVTAGYLYSGYYIPLSTNNTIEFTPTSDYNPATKKYVDDTITEAMSEGESDIGIYTWKEAPFSTSRNYNLKTNYGEFLSGIINDAYKKGKTGILIQGQLKPPTADGSGYNSEVSEYLLVSRYNIQNKPGMVTLSSYGVSAGDDAIIFKMRVRINGEWNENDEYVISSAYMDGVRLNLNNYLARDNTYSYTPTKDYHPATKKYVDDAVASIDVSGGESSGGLEKIYELTMSSINYNDTAIQRATTEEVQKLSELITQCYKDGIYRPTFIVYDKYDKPAFLKPNSAINDMGNMGWYLYGTYTTFSTPADLKGLQEIYSIACSVGGALVNGVYTATKAEFTSARKKYLPLDNTVEYTPTSDYHPTTKKYVDDAIAGVSGGSGGGADLTNYYTKAEVDALLQELRNEFVSANNNINDKLETIIYGGE